MVAAAVVKPSPFDWLFRRGDMSDCTVELAPDGDRFPGHRLVLAMHSPVIRARVERWSDVDHDRRVVVDCPESSEAGNNVIRWMYTQENVEGSTGQLIATLMVADRYEVLDLKRSCAIALDAKANDGDVEASQWLLHGVPDVVLDATLESAKAKAFARTFEYFDRTLDCGELREAFVALPLDFVRNLFVEYPFRCPEDSLLHACVTWLRANGSLDSDARALFQVLQARRLTSRAIRWTIENFEPLGNLFTQDVLCDALTLCQSDAFRPCRSEVARCFKLTYDAPEILRVLQDFENASLFDACVHGTPRFVYGRWRRPFARFYRAKKDGRTYDEMFVGYRESVDADDPTSFESTLRPPCPVYDGFKADAVLRLAEPCPVFERCVCDSMFTGVVLKEERHKLRSILSQRLQRPLEIHYINVTWLSV